MVIPSTVLGILLSAAAFLFFTCFDTASKFLSRDYSIFQVMGVEFVTATVLLVLFAVLKHRAASERRALVMNRPSLHLLRGIVQVLGQSLVFFAIPHLSLAEFYVIIFCMPIITVLKVGWFLKERPAAFVWPVLAVNFAGVLIALRPDQGMNLWALVALAGTVLLAGSLVVLRKMMESETPEMAAITASAALAIGALAVTPFVYKSVAAPDLALMVLGGALFAPAQVMLSAAFRLAPAALASPPQFLQLVYGAAGGYIVFGDVPSPWIYAGGATVIAANIYLLLAQNTGVRTRLVRPAGSPGPIAASAEASLPPAVRVEEG
ncbi:MAG TPA: DMT family transporter [Rhodomicrobium sp.]|nr:DMT family transporter [Rhodomicrobium sp.]